MAFVDAGGYNAATKAYTKLPVPVMYLTMKTGEEKVMITDEDKEQLEKSVEGDANDSKSQQK